MEALWPWIGFDLFVLAMLALDLGVFHRKAHEIHFKEAIAWSAVWILLAGVFNLLIYYWKGEQVALQFLAGYVIEKSLSVDNIFVFLMIFSYFKVPNKYQHEVLFWGIIGALAFRAVFIALGVVLIEKFHWMIYIFGAFLIITGIKMALEKDKEIHPEKNPVLKFFKKIMPVTPEYVDGKFFVKQAGKWFATPLFVVLLIVETTDIIFAVDSIPAILAVTKDPFIVYSSNVFAILGLRALFFALAGFMKLFHHLHYGLSFVLIFVGTKMLISEYFKIPIVISLCVILSALALSIIASLVWPKKGDPIVHA